MPHRIKLLLTLIAITAVSLACATITGDNPTSTPEPVPPTPTSEPTPIPEPTATPEPVPTDTTVPTTPPTESVPPDGSAPLPGSALLFADDFSNTESGWDRYNDNEGITDYQNGAYLVGVYIDTYFYWANPYRTFQDVIIDVEAEMITSEEDNQFGIICRHADVDNWYALVISADGYASVRKRYQGSDLEMLSEWVLSDAINTGMESNQLHAECIGDRLALFVNGVLAVEAFDSDIPSGDVGLIAGTFSATRTEILFDDFAVFSP